MGNSLPTRNEIVDFDDAGLVMRVEGVERVAAWSAILTVSAIMALIDRASEQRIPVLLIEVLEGADERHFLVAGHEPMWPRLVSALPDFLPGMLDVEIWSAELKAVEQVSLYERVAGMQ